MKTYRITDIINIGVGRMTLNDLLTEKGCTIYKLSKDTGIAKSTLFDIFSGKSNLLDCRLRVVLKLSKTLGISIDEIVKLDPIPYNPAYEENLPLFLQQDITFLKDKRNKNNPFYDCYLDETNSSINVCEVENLITKEQADYLRNKFLR